MVLIIKNQIENDDSEVAIIGFISTVYEIIELVTTVVLNTEILLDPVTKLVI